MEYETEFIVFRKEVILYTKKKLVNYEVKLPKTLLDDLNPPNPIIGSPLKGEHFIKNEIL